MDDHVADEDGGAARSSAGVPAEFGLRRWGRPAAAVLAFLVGCALATGGLTGWVAGRGGEVVVLPRALASTRAAVADLSGSLARIAALQPLLDRRAAAVRSGSRADWAGTLDPRPAAAAFRKAQLAEFDRIRLLPIRGWRYEVLRVMSQPGGTGAAFTARTRLTYRLPGDTRDVERLLDVDAVRRGSAWVLTGVHRVSGAADPWELGRLTVLTGRRSIVIGIGQAPARVRLRRVVADADRAAAKVDEVWGTSWRRTVVVILPPDMSGMAAVLGRQASAQGSEGVAPGPVDQDGEGAVAAGRGDVGLDQMAAVTTGELSGGHAVDGASADRIVISPSAFGRLSPLGRRVVLTHEFTHVATRATVRAPVPLWVDEGFANYVAYSGSGLSASAIAADMLPSVRTGTAEAAQEHLPAADAFDPGHGVIAPAYADAWLAFDLMARDGPQRPIEFYRVAAGLVSGGTGTPEAAAADGGAVADRGVAEAFRRVLGTDQAAFEIRWRAYRRSLAEAEGQ